MPDKPNLESRLRQFAAEYVIDYNGTKAAKAVGVKGGSAGQTANKWLKRSDVKEFIAEEEKGKRERANLKADAILQELIRIGFSDMRDFAKWDESRVSFIPSAGLSKSQSAAIMEISESWGVSGGSRKMKLHNKIQALELLGKHLSLFPNRNEHTGKDGQPLEPQAKVLIMIPDNGRDKK